MLQIDFMTFLKNGQQICLLFSNSGNTKENQFFVYCLKNVILFLTTHYDTS
jgi:hypothetical protein